MMQNSIETSSKGAIWIQHISNLLRCVGHVRGELEPTCHIHAIPVRVLPIINNEDNNGSCIVLSAMRVQLSFCIRGEVVGPNACVLLHQGVTVVAVF